MPTPRPQRTFISDPAYYLDRLARQPNALLWDEEFARGFGRLPETVRDQIMSSAPDANVIPTPRRPPRVGRAVYDAREIPWTPGVVTAEPESVSTAATDVAMRQMNDEIEAFRARHFALYRERPRSEQTEAHFVAWSRVVEAGIVAIRDRWERSIRERPLGSTLAPPPTTTPWEPRGDIERMTMFKSLPRSGRAVVIHPGHGQLEAILDQARQELPGDAFHSVVFSRLEHGGLSLERLRSRNYPIFIDHSVFDFHAEGRLDWPEGLLDELIALQAEIPDEEESPS